MPRLLALLIATSLCACKAPAPPTSPPPVPPPPTATEGGTKPDLLVVVLDTTSNDAIEAAMPNAQAFLKRGRSFSRAVSPCNSTMESVAGMMTGTWMSNARLWEDGFTLLQEALQWAGYRTYMGSANPVLDHPFYVRGMDSHHVRMQDIQRDFPDQGLVEKFVAEWGAMESPKFAWLQLAACHDYRIAGKNFIDEGPPEGEAELAEAWRAYQLDCAATDALLPQLFAANAGGLTVLTADHGELFGHRGPYPFPSQEQHGHGVSSAPAEIEVPLGFVGPGVEPAVLPGAVSTIDVRTTLLRQAGLDDGGGDLLAGTGKRPAVSAACDVYRRAARNFTAWVADDGSQRIRTDGLPDVPDLVQWNPTGTGPVAGKELKLGALTDAEAAALYGAGKLVCRSDRDLCKEHPELSSLGYIDCPE